MWRPLVKPFSLVKRVLSLESLYKCWPQQFSLDVYSFSCLFTLARASLWSMKSAPSSRRLSNLWLEETHIRWVLTRLWMILQTNYGKCLKFQHNKVNAWSSSIMDTCLQSLVKLQKPFKYIGNNNPQTHFVLLMLIQLLYSITVTCVVVQKNGAGVHTASSCFWDNTTDGSCTVRWENKTMYCIVSVFGLSI